MVELVEIPKPEYPRPQLQRAEWLNLNGRWEFEIDSTDTGWERGLAGRSLNDSIIVPFAPESKASGIANTDFMNAVWYRRTIMIPAHWQGRRVLLHFGAVDHDTTVWVNDVEVGRHRGGFSSFSFEITEAISVGTEARILVRARDPRQAVQARGKQAIKYANTDCHYTRTTGIWQTVWLEPVPTSFIRRLITTPRLGSGTFEVAAMLSQPSAGCTLQLTLRDDAGTVASVVIDTDYDLSPGATLQVPAERRRPWSPEDPHLYDLEVELRQGDTVIDSVHSYAGLRSVTIRGTDILINGRPVFQRLVLDQGYWPDTLMTSPSDQATVGDIELAMAAGFNGARLHQKIFEERFFYHADRLGYLVWGEFGDWGCSGQGPEHDHQQPTASYITQWLEALERDYNHPSIIGWCPLNETYQLLHDRITQLDDVTRGMFLATKLADPTRPVLDASGYSHRVIEADVYDSHNYEQDPALFATAMSGLSIGQPYTNLRNGQPISIAYRGQPYFVSEYGGIWWNPDLAPGSSDPDRANSWGYGAAPRSEEEVYQRFDGLTRVLLGNPLMFGYCYTQLTDVFQEENGIYRFDRSAKLDVDRIRAIQQQPAAYETRNQEVPIAD